MYLVIAAMEETFWESIINRMILNKALILQNDVIPFEPYSWLCATHILFIYYIITLSYTLYLFSEDLQLNSLKPSRGIF